MSRTVLSPIKYSNEIAMKLVPVAKYLEKKMNYLYLPSQMWACDIRTHTHFQKYKTQFPINYKNIKFLVGLVFFNVCLHVFSTITGAEVQKMGQFKDLFYKGIESTTLHLSLIHI